MRNFLKLRICKGFVSSALTATMVVGFLGSALFSPDSVKPESMGDLGSFIEEQVLTLESVPEGATLEDLGAFIKSLPEDAIPVIVTPKGHYTTQEGALSDGKFEMLHPKWRRGVVQVVREGRCKMHMALYRGTTIDLLYQEAQAIVESNCVGTARGDDDEVSVVQVMSETCKSIGITGDYAKTSVALACAEKYRTMACDAAKKRQRKCSLQVMILAHNRGIAGALRTANAESTEYLRKVDCAARVLRKQKCV
jgi:hypothetical protein